jgi:hypothetical protein
MITIFALVFPLIASATEITSAPFPVFLRSGFSSVIEFTEEPTRVVLGDTQSFQVERLDRSLILKAIAPYAATNMFVYFKSADPKLFILKASEDAEPTYYKKFEKLPIPPKEAMSVLPSKSAPRLQRGAKITLAHFDEKKDYLSVEIEVSADSREPIKPTWNLVRLKFKNQAIAPVKLWAERQDVQKDSRVKARFIFAKPNIPKDLKESSIVVPILGGASAFTLNFPGSGK